MGSLFYTLMTIPPPASLLLLSEAHGFLDGDCEFLVERLECLVRGQVETVETSVGLASVKNRDMKGRTMCVTWAAD